MKNSDLLRLAYVPISKASWLGPVIEKCVETTRASLTKLPGTELLYSGIITDEQTAFEAAARLKAEQVDAVVLHFASFPIGAAVPAAVHDIDIPVILLANPEEPGPNRTWDQNSFCGANMAAFDMNRLSRRYDYAFCLPEQSGESISSILATIRMERGVCGFRIGLAGGRVPGFYTSDGDELLLRRDFGTSVEVIDLLEIVELARTADDAAVEAARKTVHASAGKCFLAGEDDLEKGARMLAGFRRAREKYRLDSFAVRCWPEFSDIFGIAPCAVIGMLSAENTITSCEGDVYGAFTMRLLERAAGGGLPFFMDLIKFDFAANIGTVWHCGASPAPLARNPEERTFCRHMRVDGGDKKGLTNEFSLKPGRITLAKFDTGANGKSRLLLAAGTAVDTEPFLRGNPLNIRFDGCVKELMDTVMKRGFEHHYALIHADVACAMRRFCEWHHIECVEIRG